MSSNSLKPLIWILTLGSYIGSIPISWDAKNLCVRLKYVPNRYSSNKIWNWRNSIAPRIYLLLEVLNIIYLIVFLLFLEHSRIDLYLSLFFLFCFLFGTSAQLQVCVHDEELVSLINSFLMLDLKIRKYRCSQIVF